MGRQAATPIWDRRPRLKPRSPVPRIEQRVPDDHASASRQRRPCTKARTTCDPSRAGGEISAAVPEGETVRLCRWCTRAMFDRDNIIDEQDLAAAVGQRFEGTPRTQELATRG